MWTDTGGAQSSRSPRLDEEWGAAVQIRDPLCYCVLLSVTVLSVIHLDTHFLELSLNKKLDVSPGNLGDLPLSR